MEKRLAALSLPEAKLVRRAYQAFGNPLLFEPRLIDALAAIHPEQVDPRLRIHITRLSAEAYVLNIHLTAGSVDARGFVYDLDGFAASAHPQTFFRFVLRRLLELSSTSLPPYMQRLQMDKAIELFVAFMRDLDREYSRFGSPQALTEDLAFLFKIIQKHYQLLLDGLFTSRRAGNFKAAVKLLEDNFEAITATDRKFETPPEIAKFRIVKKEFRDYFDPKNATDFPFDFYSRSAPALTGEGPRIDVHDVVKQRYRQLWLLRDLQPGLRAPGTAAFPAPPRLHDNRGWQEWARRMWDTVKVSRRSTLGSLDLICDYIFRYFLAFSVHVPFDLEEGARAQSYLKRSFPRAITGGVTHDCLVYATRWVFFLGRLFSARTRPASFQNPRAWFIEMPAHVGAMIRVRVPLNRDALIVINNAHAHVTEIATDADEEEAADEVVQGMYEAVPTPILIHEIKADIANASALGRVVSKMSRSKSKLPYADPSEPFLSYLELNAEATKVEKQVGDRLGALFYPMYDRLQKVKGSKRDKVVREELGAYRKQVKDVFIDAKAAFDANVTPIAKRITDDRDEIDRRKPKAAVVTTVGDLKDWEFERARYDLAIREAMKSLELRGLDPELRYPAAGFPAEHR